MDYVLLIRRGPATVIALPWRHVPPPFRGEGMMGLPSIDINALPLLDTAVGLFGSLVAQTRPGSSVFEVTVTVVLIIHD